MSEKVRNKTHILLIGYDKIDPEPDEEINTPTLDSFYSHVTKDTEQYLKNAINFYDYDIVMVKNSDLLAGTEGTLNQLIRAKVAVSIGLGKNTSQGIDYEECCQNDKFQYGRISGVSDFIGKLIRTSSLKGKNINFVEGSQASRIFANKTSIYYSTIDELHTESPEYDSETDSGDPNDGFIISNFATSPGGRVLGSFFSNRSTSFIFHPPLKSSISNEDVRSLLNFLKESNTKAKKGPIPPTWVNDIFPEERKKLEELRSRYNNKRKQIESLSNLYWQTGKNLEKSVADILKSLGIEVENIARNGDSKDLLLKIPIYGEYCVEIKGLKGAADKDHVSNFIANNLNKRLIFMVNHYREEKPELRIKQNHIYMPFTPAALDTMRSALKDKGVKELIPVTTTELANLIIIGLPQDNLFQKIKEIGSNYLNEDTNGMHKGE